MKTIKKYNEIIYENSSYGEEYYNECIKNEKNTLIKNILNEIDNKLIDIKYIKDKDDNYTSFKVKIPFGIIIFTHQIEETDNFNIHYYYISIKEDDDEILYNITEETGEIFFKKLERSYNKKNIKDRFTF
jgi:hypothetical protein